MFYSHPLVCFLHDSFDLNSATNCVQEIRKVQNPDVGPGVSGPGGGGKIGHTNHTLLTQYLLEKGGMQKLEEQIDPREAFLRHKSAENDMKAWTKAYAKTQPQKQFADPDEENDGQM